MEEEKTYPVTSFQCTQDEAGMLLSLNASMMFERESLRQLQTVL